MPDTSRFDGLETDDVQVQAVGDATKKDSLTIEKIVEHMARNGIASIHCSIPETRPNDGYKEVKYKTVPHKK